MTLQSCRTACHIPSCLFPQKRPLATTLHGVKSHATTLVEEIKAEAGTGKDKPEPGKEGDLDAEMSLADVVCEDCADDVAQDDTIRVRRKSKRALILEASSEEHKRSHFPHNPFVKFAYALT